MSNEDIQKDAIGEHEGFLNNPMLTFFIAFVLIALFAILGQALHVSKRTVNADELDRQERFERIKKWRADNAVNLESYASGQDSNGATSYFQIPLSEAKSLLIKEHAQAN